MSEALVIIGTFNTLDAADRAQVELLSAGIQSILYAEDPAQTPAQQPVHPGVSLAVHRRDSDRAVAVLTPTSRVA